uniref:Uncharacterized protein n=1 Tax=Amphiprion percula TaxID=161767 RepID=A0A3P8SYQ5_AMPPE
MKCVCFRSCLQNNIWVDTIQHLLCFQWLVLPQQMTQNMFQEGLYHVLNNARIHRWFGTVVNTRLCALACILSTITHACVSYSCFCLHDDASVTNIESKLFVLLQYVAAGCLAMEVQRKANKVKVNSLFNHFLHNFFFLLMHYFFIYTQQIIALIGLNVFSVLFGFCALLVNSIRATHPVAINTYQQVTAVLENMF